MYKEKNTYKGLTDVILNIVNNKEIFETIFNEIYYIKFSDEQNNKVENNIDIRDQKLQSILNIVDKYRNEFKDKLHNARQVRNSKLVQIDLINNGKNIIFPLKIIESAHIFEVKKIKEIIISAFHNNSINDEMLESFYQDVQNPNNGLLLDCNLHKAFDSRLFNFDINGKIIFNEEDKESIKSLGIESAEINPKILNDEMKQFILKR